MTWLAMISGLSLFSGIDWRVSGVVARPFDMLAAVMGLVLLAKVMARGTLKIPPGVIWLIPFSLITALSAATISMGNGVREGLQMAIVITFALSYANADDPYPSGAKWLFLAGGIWGLMLFNIGWHVSEGHYTGWKKLYELKHTIGLTILLTVAWIGMKQFRPNPFQLLIFGLLGGIVVLSGERKSLIIYVFAALILMNGIGLKRSLKVLIAPVAVMAITLMFFADDYTMRHIESLTLTTEYNLEGVPTSFSNQQRAFALETGWQMLQESPLIGVGTNAYDMMIERAFANYPVYFLKGIHSEFFRILVENGIVGFLSYVMIWVIAAFRTWNLANILRATGRMDRLQAKSYLLVSAMMFMTSAVICGLEASGTDLFLLLALVSLWPDLSRTAILQRTAQVRRPVVPSIETSRA